MLDLLLAFTTSLKAIALLTILQELIVPIAIDQETVAALTATNLTSLTATDLEILVALTAINLTNLTAIDQEMVAALIATNPIPLEVQTVINQPIETTLKQIQEAIILEEDEKSIYKILLKHYPC